MTFSNTVAEHNAHTAAMAQTAKAHLSHAGMDHSSMSTGSVSHADMSMDEDCCDTDCKCPVNACTSFTYIGSLPYLDASPVFAEKFDWRTTAQPKPTLSSLYRPPIAA